LQGPVRVPENCDLYWTKRFKPDQIWIDLEQGTLQTANAVIDKSGHVETYLKERLE